MRRLTIHISIPFVLIFLFFSQISPAQMIINSGPEVTPIDMVECILGEGVQYSNVTFQGADISRGIFLNGDSTNIGIDKGVFLTSGAGYIIPGPNNANNAGVSNVLVGHPLLNILITGTTYDACVLEFDFIPEFDTLKLEFVFGSEEYPYLYPNPVGFNDVCGIFVTGLNPSGGYYNDVNIALVPGTALPITCNTINSTANSQYFIDNSGGQTIQYNGFTTVLTAILTVVPCEEYHLMLGVADAGDHIIDSGVLIKENSITCPRIDVETYLDPPGILETMVEEFIQVDIVFKLPNIYYSPLSVYFEVDGTADPQAYPPGDFEEEIPTEITFEEDEDSITINVKPVYDAIIEGEETLELIVENTLGCFNWYDTVVFSIQDYFEMVSQTSPNTMICYGQEIDMWVHVDNGFPPYTYLWETGGFTTDSITVSPEESMTYKVTYSDMFTSGSDSIMVIVFPLDYEVFSFSFQAENNPVLFADVIGEIFEDSISLDVPYGINLNNLIATFSLSDGAWALVNGMDQISGVTPNDFTEPVTYKVIAPGGCMKDWMVNVNLVTGQSEDQINTITIFPNPAKDRISISNAKGNKLTVLNSLGAVMLERYFDEDKLNLDVSDFVDGVYYLQFSNDQRWFVEKIIINR